MAASKSRSKAKAARPTSVADYLASLGPQQRTVIEEARTFVPGQPLSYVGLGAHKSYVTWHERRT